MQEIIEIAKQKASQSASRYKISAIAFNKKGEIIATATNSLSKYDSMELYKGIHAEIAVLGKCKRKPNSILICRVNGNGDILPIHPCVNCTKELKKRKIKILTVGVDEKITKIRD